MTTLTRRITATAATTAAGVLSLTMLAAPAQAATPSPKPIQIAALGDSISNGTSVTGQLGQGVSDPTASWSTGTSDQVDSHQRQLSARGFTVESAVRYSVDGAQSADIAGQAANVAAGTDYATILVGANDICTKTDFATIPSKATYKANIQAGVDALLARNPKTVILLGSVPNLKTLYAAGIQSPYGQYLYSTNLVCPLAVGTFSGETAEQALARQDAVDARVQEYNSALAEIAAALPTVYDDSDAVYDTQFSLEHISTADYFHPSVLGQDILAERTFAAADAQGVYGALQAAVVPAVAPETQSVSGKAQARFTITSDSAIVAATLAGQAPYGTIALTQARDGSWRTPVVNTKPFKNGTYTGTVTATDADGDVTVQTVRIVVSN